MDFTVPSGIANEPKPITEENESSSEDSDSSEDNDSSETNSTDSSNNENKFEGKSLTNVLDKTVIFGKHDVVKCEPARNDNIDDEIALLNECDNMEELYQLLSTDPEYYLKILEQRRDIANKYNCQISRSADKQLNVKFKLYPEDRWTEVGYFDEGIKDDEIYKDFATKVELVIKNSKGPRKHYKPGEPIPLSEVLNDRSRDHLNGELDKEDLPMDIKQKIEEKKQDREIMMSKLPKYVPANPFKPNKSFKTDNINHEELPKPINTRIMAKSNTSMLIEDISDDKEDIDPYSNLLEAYVGQILQRMIQEMPKWLEIGKIHKRSTPINSNVCKRFEKLIESCPPHLRPYYQNMIKTFKQGIYHNEFIEELNELRDTLPGSMTNVLDKMINKIMDEPYPTTIYYQTDLSHELICHKLALSQSDIKIMASGKIDLQKEWNSYVQTFN